MGITRKSVYGRPILRRLARKQKLQNRLKSPEHFAPQRLQRGFVYFIATLSASKVQSTQDTPSSSPGIATLLIRNLQGSLLTASR
ncbi:hypothetical protein D3C77_682980 [compost metagenome]